jgi:hypothetical protein
MKNRLTLTLSAIGATFLLTAQGAVIVPVAWKQSNAFNTSRLASNLSNSTGMNVGETLLFNTDGTPSGEASNVNNISWVTSAKTTGGGAAGINAEISENRVWVVVDLGASYDLTTITIWNLNWDPTDANDYTDRGISQFDLYVRDTAADTNDGTVGGDCDQCLPGQRCHERPQQRFSLCPWKLGSVDLGHLKPGALRSSGQ